MERLKELTDLLSEIKSVSREIILETVKLMEELKDIDNDMVDEILEKYPREKPENVLRLLRGAADSISHDPHQIIKQIDTFTKYLLEGKEELVEHLSEYEYLAEVWYGDIYNNQDGITGLKELLKELRLISKNVNEDRLVQIAAKNIRRR